MAARQNKYKRRQYFIKKGFQIRFIIKFCLILIGGVLLSTSLLYFFSQDTLTSTFQDSKLIVQSTAMSILPAIIYTNLITLSCISLATIIITLFVSHKIAGPLYRVEAGMSELGKGDLSHRISFREKDQIRSMASSFNDMAANLSQKFYAVQQEIDELEKLAQHQNMPQEYRSKIQKVRETITTNFTVDRERT